MLAAAAIGFTSCNDSFMERYPDTSLTEQTVFSNYNTFKTYAWGLYGVFTNTNILRIPGTNGAYASATSYTSDIYAGYLMRRQGDGNPYAFQNVSSSSSGNGWAFSFVYRVNVMLALHPPPPCTQHSHTIYTQRPSFSVPFILYKKLFYSTKLTDHHSSSPSAAQSQPTASKAQ